MPWNPVHKFPNLIELLIQKGYKNKISKTDFENEIIRFFGVTSKNTISNYINIMVRLEYIEESGNLIILKKIKDDSNVEFD